MKLILSFLFSSIIVFGALLLGADGTSVSHPERINGVSLVNPFRIIDSLEMSEIKRVNGSWVAVIPFGFSRQGGPEVHFNHERQWWGERIDGCKELIRLAHQNELKVMMKPHIWMREGWIGEFELGNEQDWLIWEEQYTTFILEFAKLSEEMSVELLCIGTELKQTTASRAAFWKQLIPQIREVYSGKLTYAANWDNYQAVSFWNQLDYIGIDAYFPLTDNEQPTSQELMNSCKQLNRSLRKYSESIERPILFTEYGFRSAKGGAGNHWELTQNSDVDLKIQDQAYEALMSSFWDEDWFAGGFLWKWHFHNAAGGLSNNDFTPQNKPVEATIKKWYERTSL